MSRTVHKTCNLCEATCGLLIEVGPGEGPDAGRERVRSIRPDEDDPFSRGHACPKSIALKEIQEDPERLRAPLRRRGRDWEEVSWEAALEEVASRLAGIQRRDGDDAVATYLGNPGAHDFGVLATIMLFNRAFATRNRYTASSLDQNPRHAASQLLYGNVFSIPVPDMERTDFLLMLGANPIVSNGSLMTAPGFRRRARELKARGGRLVVVDPRRSETAAIADEHLFIRPGADGWLLAAMLHTLFAEGRTRPCAASARVDGMARLESALAPFAPEAVAARTGIDAARIRGLARDFADAPRAAAYGRVGTSLHPYATVTTWLTDVLNIATGNLDVPGGSMWTTPAVDLVNPPPVGGPPLPDWRTRVRGAPSFNGEQPTACMAEEMLVPGPGQVRGLLSVAGNPVLSAPNGRQLERALAGLEYYAAVDIYVNETTRHADLILPPLWSLEQDNYELVFHQVAVRNTAKFSPAVLAPPAGGMASWAVQTEIALRLMEKKSVGPVRLAWRTARAARGALPPRRLLDWLIRWGPHGDGFRPWRRGLRLRDLERSPKGVDLGPLEPALERVLKTPDGRIDLAAPRMHVELERLAADLREPASAGLVLIGRRDPRTNNSWLHNAPMAVKGRERCTLLVHPADAERLGLKEGSPARIRSRVGEVVAPVAVRDELMPGVVSLPHGWGHGREGTRLSLANAHPGVSLNDLTDEQWLEPVVGNAILNGVPVEVEALG